ncbi:hypothetical protein RUM43_015116 [Polyplax serrata]|uniref:HRDC domain-containing protein n=1 Tax=Polyplax serrata TaxID=468196 RepID=A0AAN8NP32_POLSC
MQISTRDADYIIDTLTLRSALQELNKVFTDPSKVKVFHGADADILWLQRDLSLYVVNMFDTHQAAKLLNYPNLSLAYLLQHFCNVIAQKHFQLADWRIRPLPQELITYAREDTHYLLYIYDNLKNSLLEKCNGQTNLLESAIKESTRICSKVYVKPPFDKDGHLDIYHRSKKLFDNRQKFALQRLFEWRDATARNLDESLAYVLPNHMMLNISEILPREAQGILACCNPVPLPVRQNLLHLHSIILKAREEQLVKPVLEEQRLCRFSTRNSASDNPLHCPHDLNHDEDFRDDLPILLALSKNGKTDFKAHDSVACLKPIVNVFEKIEEASPRVKSLVRLSPYSRYKLAKKYSESIESQASKPNDTIECDKSKIKECEVRHVMDTPYHEEKKTTIRTSVNSDLNEKEKDYQARGNTDNAGENGSKQNTNRHCSKRTLHVEPCKATKKRKAMESVVLSRKTDVNFTNDNMTRKRIKKRQETHFVPYSYESVNFEQYQTSAATVKNPTKKSVRTRCKKVKRNLKISI